MFSIIFLSISLLFFTSALFLFLKTINGLKNGFKTDAVVLDNIEVESGDGPSFKAVLEYSDLNNLKHTYSDKHLSNPPYFKVGAVVKIVYNPTDFKDVKILSFWRMYGVTLLLLVCGLASIFISIIEIQ